MQGMHGSPQKGHRSCGCRLFIAILSSLTVAIFLRPFCAIKPSVRPSSSLPTTQTFSEEKRPIAILHVGPRRTASTAIQYVLSRNTTKDLLEKDSFVYLGKGNGSPEYNRLAPVIKRCFGKYIGRLYHQKCDDDRLLDWQKWFDWVDQLQGHLRNKQNVILSDEALTHNLLYFDSLRLLEEAFRGWDVRVVVTYRRYYEWLLSEHNKETKGGPPKPATFVKWYRQQMRWEGSRVFAPWDQEMSDKWSALFPVIDVFNMHSCDQDLLTCFLCKMVPEAPAACQGAMEGRLPRVPQKYLEESDVSVDAMVIARAAISYGMVRGRGKQEVATAIRDFMTHGNITSNEASAVALPLKCLKPVEKRDILNASITIERDMVPEFFSSVMGERALRSGFEKAVEDKRFCSVDLDQLMREMRWHVFFKEISNP